MTDVLQAIKDIVHTYPSEVEAYLFGSRARGDNRPDSDWDVLLILNKDKVSFEDHSAYSYPLRELGWDVDAEINPILFSRSQWQRQEQTTLFYHNVISERVKL